MRGEGARARARVRERRTGGGRGTRKIGIAISGGASSLETDKLRLPPARFDRVPRNFLQRSRADSAARERERQVAARDGGWDGLGGGGGGGGRTERNGTGRDGTAANGDRKLAR